MLKCMCDLCGAEVESGDAETVSKRNRLKVTFSGSYIVWEGDICSACYSRLKDFLNLPKED